VVKPSDAPVHKPTPPVPIQKTALSLRRAIARFNPKLALRRQRNEDLQEQAAIKSGLDQLQRLLHKLDRSSLRIVVFGLVSRGKSAVINALIGEKVLETGPLNGVTQWPRSVYWTPPVEAIANPQSPVQLELIDTPGLDEIAGQSRAAMAADMAQQADLILFVVSGDITRTEHKALEQLCQTQKPLLLVFNKIDLYPDTDQQAIYQNLQTLWRQTQTPPLLRQQDIVRVAAEPAPIPVRVEWPDGRITEEWESPPPQMEELKQALNRLLQRDGPLLVALNTLAQASEVETELARHTRALHQAEVDELILRFAKYKALAIALNPIALLDLAGGAVADLLLIRALARLYGMPMTSYDASRLWRAIVRSSGAGLMTEVGSGVLLSLGKGAAAVTSVFDSPSALAALAGTMAAQAGAAGYGTYTVGRAAQIYLAQGCSWGPDGINTVINQILNQVEPDSTLQRLRQDLAQRFQVPDPQATQRP
jgi:small GTP-binding protein